MTVLSSELRSALERAIVAARDAAEAASRVVLGILGVDAERVSDHLDEDARRLRVALRAEARQLGEFERLVEECAYEQWHRMLFARFLAENELLIHPDHGVAVSLADCEEIAHDRGLIDPWLVASAFASVMLPGIFRPDDPVLQLRLAPEGQQALEEILAALPSEVFTSGDGLGWVYQYWQAKKKQEVNASERKIGGADIAPVTQLFTEHYMVRFLLENTLGAWWATRHPDSPLVQEWEYLRYDEDGRPAAGGFPGWPETVTEVTVMDPCCGSGHFLVTAFEMLKSMRMEEEGLTAAQAGDAVLRDNLFGLELDARCTQIAAFALALQAWKTGGYRELPVPNVASSGISTKGRLEDWKTLAAGDERLEASLERLHALFADASDLGSLIDPMRESDGDLLAARFEEVAPLLEKALRREVIADPSAAVFGSAAAGAARAVVLLARHYTLVVTNPPFLGVRKQEPRLREFIDSAYRMGRADLATAMLIRAQRFTDDRGTVAMVTPQNWLFLGSYSQLRKDVLKRHQFESVALLGSGAFETISGAVVNVALVVITQSQPSEDHAFMGLDLDQLTRADEKKAGLRDGPLVLVGQKVQLSNPDHRLVFTPSVTRARLGDYADCLAGIMNGDSPRFQRMFWEFSSAQSEWVYQQSTVAETTFFGGRERVIYFDEERGHLRAPPAVRRHQLHNSDQRGNAVWGRVGVAVSQMSNLSATLYSGHKFDSNVAAVVPADPSHVPAIWVYCTSTEFVRDVRQLDRKMNVTNATIAKVPFDLERWTAAARAQLPSGLPSPHSDDPTQWLFAGHPRTASAPLHVAVARLLGFRWPRQSGSEFPDCSALTADGLEPLADEDGILCVASVRGEGSAVERVRTLLATAFGEEWSSEREADLLAEVGYAAKSFEQWLRDGFFEQHCQLFHQRPFVWQVWDGRKDGFSALVNYHRLDRATLERLAYTYLGDWIRQQRAGVEAGAVASELRLAAAQELQNKLQLILDGGPPYDIFVRWKPLAEQPVAWEPDLNDGVRVNIRPFVIAGVLRKNPKINWNKDRGKDPASAPWYAVFNGDRINDHHLTLAEKRAAREAASKRDSA